MAEAVDSVKKIKQAIAQSTRASLVLQAQDVMGQYSVRLDDQVAQAGLNIIKECEDILLTESVAKDAEAKTKERATEGEMAKLTVRLEGMEVQKMIQDKTNVILALHLRMQTEQLRLNTGTVSYTHLTLPTKRIV